MVALIEKLQMPESSSEHVKRAAKRLDSVHRCYRSAAPVSRQATPSVVARESYVAVDSMASHGNRLI